MCSDYFSIANNTVRAICAVITSLLLITMYVHMCSDYFSIADNNVRAYVQ